MKMGKSTLTLLAAGILWIAWSGPVHAQPVKRALFIGSEYISANDLPDMVEHLAAGLNDPLMAGKSVMPGFRLMQHFQLNKTMLLLQKQRWDYVIIQEHGRLPLDKSMRERSMIPAVARFNTIVTRTGARSVLFMTWGWIRGVKESGYDDFFSMQKELSRSYQQAADHGNIMIAPVGEAFRRAMNNDLGIVLLYSDGHTPTLAGSYLAACVIYATIYQKSPFGSAYHAGLKPEQAKYLQDLSGEVVLKQRRRWNLPDPPQ